MLRLSLNKECDIMCFSDLRRFLIVTSCSSNLVFSWQENTSSRWSEGVDFLRHSASQILSTFKANTFSSTPLPLLEGVSSVFNFIYRKKITGLNHWSLQRTGSCEKDARQIDKIECQIYDQWDHGSSNGSEDNILIMYWQISVKLGATRNNSKLSVSRNVPNFAGNIFWVDKHNDHEFL